MPSRVVIVLLLIAAVMLGGLIYVLSEPSSFGPATLPEIGPGAHPDAAPSGREARQPGAKAISGSAFIPPRLDGSAR
jgi:hypothetical protein